jgi:hypothetical protein
MVTVWRPKRVLRKVAGEYYQDSIALMTLPHPSTKLLLLHISASCLGVHLGEHKRQRLFRVPSVIGCRIADKLAYVRRSEYR